MQLENTQLRVFDHANGDLLTLAVQEGFQKVKTADQTEKMDEEAAASLLDDPVWRIALVHIDDGPWSKLCKGIGRDCVAVRFSTNGFAPHPPEGTSGVCIRCLKSPSQLTATDVRNLRVELAGRADALRKHLVPQRLGDLISFQEPNYLCAIYILLTGVLAKWAADPLHAKNGLARERLRLSHPLHLAPRQLCDRKWLWQGLGLDHATDAARLESAATLKKSIAIELGISELTPDQPLSKIVEAILTGPLHEIPSDDDILTGFTVLQEFVTKR